MKKISSVYNGWLLLLLLVTAGCQKVIHVDIKSVGKKYVIEGTVADYDDSYSVIVSQTLNVSDLNLFKGVEDAVVTIAEEGKLPVLLQHKGNGLYRANASGTPGKTYDLFVRIGAEVFTARSSMPQKVAFDSLYTTGRQLVGRRQLIATVEFKDPPGLGNAYRFTQLVDGEKENTIFVTNDQLIDGRNVVYELLMFSSDTTSDLKRGDNLRVEMRCINTDNYNFWYSLAQSALGQSQSASPGNPVSNIRGGALGYFSANTFDKKDLFIK
ncbi:DUF4249 family protein [Niabella drilacis]|uniref:DUF4249 domain-containing protein n=1 Tax=Niabella drilacis (strain DSM 25811 / CCM 8410 / CCUG 62505 / LMG 26954 / E90) TaxID=1285928 RepID=A0A1G6ZQ45_NIADE|nr:DUF4249 family protein [Niabella drilacis]SDE04680.1 protein of unknown function [Niabella drilacis]